MLLHIQKDGVVTSLPGVAHIVIALNAKGMPSMQTFSADRPDSAFFTMADSRLIEREMPRILQELRVHIQNNPTVPE